MDKEPEKNDSASAEASPQVRPDAERRRGSGGFSARVVVGFAILGLLVLPAVLVPALTIGSDMAMAWEWAAVIVLVELARRLSVKLAPGEVFLLRYAAANLSEIAGGLILGGGILGLIAAGRFGEPALWRTCLGSGGAEGGPTIWGLICGPIGIVVVLAIVLAKLTQLSLGYLVYRMTAVAEHLPFPLAIAEARTAAALADRTSSDAASGKSSACGGGYLLAGLAIGFIFGLLQLALPIISASLGRPVRPLIPPMIDLTAAWENFLPGGTFGIMPSILLLAVGMVLPWRVCVGAFAGSLLVQLVVNPFILRPAGLLDAWRAGGDAFAVQAACGIDFYISLGIGAAAGVGFVGLWCMAKVRLKKRAAAKSAVPAETPAVASAGRRFIDSPSLAAICVFLAAAIAFIFLSDNLINGPAGQAPRDHISIFWLAAFALVFTPINAYCNARLSGIAGPGASPMGDSWTALGGRKDLLTWLAPLPAGQYGGMAHMLRMADLSGSGMRAIIKAELVLLPLALAAGAVFWGLLAWSVWGLDGLGHHWPAAMQLRAWSAAAAQHGPGVAAQAVKGDIIAGGFLATILLIGGFALAGASTLFVYGAIAGVNILPHVIIPIFAGACLGRYVLPRMLDARQFGRNVAVLAGGVAGGLGLAALLATAGSLIIAAAGG
ncbi:MAG: hypothetical protein HZA50_05865 [Planctomycetes bacterium]|nr:hypothetical protein [Planctomycetota bacterium]